MVYKNFRLICIVRIVLLLLTFIAAFFLIIRTSKYSTAIIAGILIIYQVYALIHYVDRTNRDLSRFMAAIKYEDFSQTFSAPGLGSSFNELKTAFNEVLAKFQATRAEKEQHFRYLQTVVQHVGIGLLTFQKDGQVDLINNAAKRLLKVTRLKNIHELETFSKPLVTALLKLSSGEKNLVKFYAQNELFQLAVYGTEFILGEKQFILASLQNISSELEEKEMEAWQNLIRVLTHEIMNSITPISSLASTANDILSNLSTSDIQSDQSYDENIEDIRGAVQTIQKRSQGLLHFVESYRKLTRIPRPDFKIFEVASLFERVIQLMKAQLTQEQIKIVARVTPPRLELTADPELVEQVLLNLVINARDAIKAKTDGQISLQARLDEKGRVNIQVSDNGAGISEDILDKIFIPFFTTKEHGSGVGLSISKQIMRLHRGSIAVQSNQGRETTFILKF